MKMGKVFSFALSLIVLVMGFAFAPDASAAGNLGDVAGNITTSIDAFMKLAVNFAFLGGAVLFVAGLFLIYKDTKQPGQNHMKNGVIAIIVGVCLLSMPTLVETVTNTGGIDGGEGKKRINY